MSQDTKKVSFPMAITTTETMTAIDTDEDLGEGMNAFTNASGALVIIQDERKPVERQVYVHLTPAQVDALKTMLNK